MALTIKQIAHALEAKAGNITQAARALGVTRDALHKRIAKSEELQRLVIASREELVDIAESTIRKNIRKGDVASTIFVLKTLGKNRGYVERQEITGADSGAIKIEEVSGAGERILSRIDSIAAKLGAGGNAEPDRTDTGG